MAVPDEEWLALGRAFEEAQRRSRTRARQLADHLINVDAPAARENLSGTYLEGRTTGWEAYTRDLGVPDDIDDARLQSWVQEAAVKSTDMMERLIATVENRDEVTRVFIDNYANVATNNTLWEGIDESGVDVARLAEAQYKTWVRSWSRKQQRDWHSWNEGISIPIEDKFRLMGGPNSGALVDGPRDWQAVNDPREHINCGHALRFTTVKESDLAPSDVPGATVYNPPEPIALSTKTSTTTTGTQTRVTQAPEDTRDQQTGSRDYERLKALMSLALYEAEDNRNMQRETQLESLMSVAYKQLKENKDPARSDALFAEYDSARQAWQNERARAGRDAIHPLLSRSRGERGATVERQNPAERVDPELVRRITAAQEWVNQYVSARSIPSLSLGMYETDTGREFHRPFGDNEGIYLVPPDTGKYKAGTREDVILHEIAHAWERSDEDVRKATNRFFYRRTVNDKNEQLSAVTGIAAYGPLEITRKDAFFDPYVGRVYTNGDGATEVLSMGLQELFANPATFAQEDREHFDLIVAIVTGNLKWSRFYVPPGESALDF